jgi:hypothetical protein
MTSRQAKIQEDTNFRIMRILLGNPDLIQRELAYKLGMSVGGAEILPQRPNRQGLCEDGEFFHKQEKVQVWLPSHPPGHCQKGGADERFPEAKDGRVRDTED